MKVGRTFCSSPSYPVPPDPCDARCLPRRQMGCPACSNNCAKRAGKQLAKTVACSHGPCSETMPKVTERLMMLQNLQTSIYINIFPYHFGANALLGEMIPANSIDVEFSRQIRRLISVCAVIQYLSRSVSWTRVSGRHATGPCSRLAKANVLESA